jgi:integrase
MQTKEDILDYWFEKRNLSTSTRDIYGRALQLYSKITGKTITELYEEADKEEEEGVRLKKRKYSLYVIKFKKDLINTNKSEHTIRIYLNAIKSFYQSHDIRPPEITMSKGDITLEKNYGRLLTKEQIQKMASVAYTRDRAILYVMALSGMSQKELRDLTVKKFIDSVAQELGEEIGSIQELLKHEKTLITDTVILLEITREKVHYRYHTFLPPETTKQILIYLRERENGENDKIRIKDFNKPLFVKVDGNKLTIASIATIFKRMGQRAGFKHEPGTYRSWRSHGMRKYFISTIINYLGDHILADYLAAHKIDDIKRRYWFADTDKLKEKYLLALPFLSLEEVEIHTIQSPEFTKVLLKLDEKELELEKQNKRIKRLEKYFEEKDMLDKIKKPD